MQTEKKAHDKITISFWIAGIIGVAVGLGFLLFGLFAPCMTFLLYKKTNIFLLV